MDLIIEILTDDNERIQLGYDGVYSIVQLNPGINAVDVFWVNGDISHFFMVKTIKTTKVK